MNEWYEAEQRAEKAQDLFAQRKWHEALKELRAAIAINPYNSAWHFNLGLTLDELERFAEAMEAFRAALEIDPKDVEALHHIGVDLIRLGRLNEAIFEFERIQAIDSTFERSYCDRIIAYAEQGEHEKAEEMFYLARQYKEDCPHCYYNIGVSLARRRLFDKAIFCWQKTLDMDESFPEVHRRIAEALWEKGELEQSRLRYLQELRREPGDISALLELGSLLMEMGRIEEAGEKIRRAIELAPDEAAVYYCHGRWLLMTDRLPAAEDAFEQALRLDRRCPGAQMSLGEIHLHKGDPIAARRHLRMELRSSPREPRILMRLSNLLLDCDQNRLATACLKRLIELQPENPSAWQNLAVAHFMAGRWKQGMSATQQALRCDPSRTTAMFNLALAYERQGDLAHAVRWVRKAMRLEPNDASLQRLELRLKLLRGWRGVLRILRGFIFWKRGP